MRPGSIRRVPPHVTASRAHCAASGLSVSGAPLCCSSDPEEVVNLILEQEPQIGDKRRPLLQGLVESQSGGSAQGGGADAAAAGECAARTRTHVGLMLIDAHALRSLHALPPLCRADRESEHGPHA